MYMYLKIKGCERHNTQYWSKYLSFYFCHLFSEFLTNFFFLFGEKQYFALVHFRFYLFVEKSVLTWTFWFFSWYLALIHTV